VHRHRVIKIRAAAGRPLIAAAAALVAVLGVGVWVVVAHADGRQPVVRNAASANASKGISATPSVLARPSSPPSPSPSPSPTQTSVVAGMRLAFHQEFTGSLDRSVWDTCYPWAANPAGCTNFSNPEEEWYLPSQVQVTGGALHLIAQKEATAGTTKSGQPEQYSCRSGMITSYPGFQFQYGYVSIVAQVPMGEDLWSGLWLAAANFQWPPEIDLVESYGPPISKAITTFHPVNAAFAEGQLPAAQFASLSSGWHTFSLLWYLDNAPVMTITAHIPGQKMYLVANLANYTGAGTGAGSCNGQLLIRSIDVWQNS
jgi:beta-glucanase (GH16 family)